MSDVTSDAPVPETTLPGLSVTTETRGTGDGAVEVIGVSWGDPRRSIAMKPLDLGDQFDLAEVTGPNAANAVWINMATVAASVREIEGVPVPRNFTREGLKATLNRLGMDGLRAGMLALNGYRGGDAPASPDAHKQKVGN